MHQFFSPLDLRETMALLTMLTIGGSHEAVLFEHWPEPGRTRLKEKAAALADIPAEKRVPFMVHEMKRSLAFKGLRGIEKVDPSWLIRGMRGESPRVVATVLIGLPSSTVRSLLKKMPDGVRKKLPPKNEVKSIPMEVVRAVREIFESRFDVMPTPSRDGFAFRDIIQLEKNDIYRLMRELGLIELGQAFAAVGKIALAELCRRLPRKSAEELIMAVRSASRIDLPDLKTAQRFLSRVVVNFNDTDEFFQKAGLWRLTKCSLMEDEVFRGGFRQRLPREAGRLYDSFFEKTEDFGELDEGQLQRLQDSVLQSIHALAQRKAISSRWENVNYRFYDPDLLKNLALSEAKPDEGSKEDEQDLGKAIDELSDTELEPPQES
jgi:hypothetical protein